MDKNSFFKSAQPKITPVEIDKTTYYVKHLSIAETLDFEAAVKEQSSAENAVSVLIACVCDQDGKALLTPEDTEAIKTIDSTVAVALYKAALRINSMSEDEIDSLKKS